VSSKMEASDALASFATENQGTSWICSFPFLCWFQAATLLALTYWVHGSHRDIHHRLHIGHTSLASLASTKTMMDP
jgi:hypothetical protein